MKLTTKVPCPKCKTGISVEVEIKTFGDRWQIKCWKCKNLFIIDAEFSVLIWPVELKGDFHDDN